MNFVAQVEDHLRDLGAEARKNHPGVKEASERAIIHLRSLQTQYVAAVRRAGASSAAPSAKGKHGHHVGSSSQKPPSSGGLHQHPTTALFQSEDVLRPFLLAANYPDASYEMLVIALESMQLLLRGNAVRPEDGAQVCRVLLIQSRGCAGTLGLGGGGGGAGGDSSVGAGGGMAAGMIHGVSGALGGITGMVLGGGGSSDGGASSSSNPQHASHRSAKEDESVALKILQTITMLVDSRSMSLTQEVLGSCLAACSVLGAGQGCGGATGGAAEQHGGGAASRYAMGASIRERLSQTASSKDVAVGTAGGGGGPAGNVKRASMATLNQLLSTLFDRARDEMMEQLEATVSTPSILAVAERTLSDLCSITLGIFSTATSSGQQRQQQQTTPSKSKRSSNNLTGPFSIAAKEGLLPSSTASLALVDMIARQACPDLFKVCFGAYGSSDQFSGDCDDDGEGARQPEEAQATTAAAVGLGVQFAVRIIREVFCLGQSLLGSQYCYHVTRLSLESSLKMEQAALSSKSSSASSPSSLLDFCAFYYTTTLATTVLTGFLSSSSESFYVEFDRRAFADTGDLTEASNGSPATPSATASGIAVDIMKQLVSFVSEATEAYHKSDDFEDGYIFTQTERESFDILKANSNRSTPPSTRGSVSHHQAGQATQHHPPPASSISNEKLWRACLALQALCHVVSSHSVQASRLDLIINQDRSSGDLTISSIAKAASDFATISASNRERILHLLMAAHTDDDITQSVNLENGGSESNRDSSGSKTVASDAVTESENSVAAATLAAKVTDALVLDSIDIPVCDAGATTWLAFKCIVQLVRSLKKLATLVDANEEAAEEPRRILTRLVIGSFAPSVSVLQHFIRRMLGSPVIVSRTLSSYEELACASMTVDNQSTNVRRQAIIMSLCKLCLPHSWGKKRPNCQLKESNIDSLWTMLWIIHSNFEKISEEWDIILSTLDQLSIIQISSSKLQNTYSDRAKTIAGCFVRLPSFTTCFSGGSLSQFIASLVKLSAVVSFEPLVDQPSDFVRESSENSNVGDPTEASDAGKEPSIGGKLMSFAGRAFGGGGPAPSTSVSNGTSFRKTTSIGANQLSKTYSDDMRETTCSQMAKMKISTPRSTIRKIPLPLLLIAVVSEANSYRFPVIEEAVANHLCEIVARSSSTELRSFAMEILIHFMPTSLFKSEMSPKYGSGPLMVPDRENKNELPLEVHPISTEDINLKSTGQSETDDTHTPQLLKILCETIQRSTQVDTAENCLNALLVVLEGTGHNLSGDNLIIVIKTLSVLSGWNSEDCDDEINRSAKKWANVSSLAFANLKLILEEFLEPTSTSSDSPLKSTDARNAIVDCCVAFGKSRHDVNTSLTATGMLWSLADRDPSPGTLDVVLSKLAFLAMDNRPELRNCSVNTLLSCVVGLGDQFSDEQWEACLNDKIFGVMDGIASAMSDCDSENKGADSNADNSGERYRVAVHHSRDSAKKQWATTQILVIRGFERVLRLFFLRLLGTREPWFLQTWKKILKISLECAIVAGERETLDMRLAGVELMALCAQLSCRAGIVAAGSSARVGTNMEVVGGALRSVRAAVEDKVQETSRTSILDNPEVDSRRQELFDVAFDELVAFGSFLEQHGKKSGADVGDEMAIDSLLGQVLTKMTSELAKLYECCKKDEMKPGPCAIQLDISIEDADDTYESRFLHLLHVIGSSAGNDGGSRYLNQVQRGVMSLLQGMASNSSLRAFKALASISGLYMFVRPKALSLKSNDDDDDDRGEIFELEAAKTVASAFDSDDLTDEAKVVVMCSVLRQYNKIYGNSKERVPGSNEEKRKTSEARYDFITRVIESGLDAAANIDGDGDGDDSTVLDSVWDRTIETVSSLLLPSAENRYGGYAYHSKSILNIVAVLLSHLPHRKLSLAEPMLENGANLAVDVAFECNEEKEADTNTPFSQAAEGAVHVFLACFMGLCQKMPTCPAVSSLTNKILGETIESEDGNAGLLQSKTRQSLAIAVCESLRTTTSQDLLVGVFPLLCRLTNVENDGLRRAAGKILGGVNLSEAISRERHRAEQADTRAREMEEENIAMLEEIEYLQAENEELQRQLAVFSESSDFT